MFGRKTADEHISQRQQRSKSLSGLVFAMVLLAVTFGIGIGVGNGRINLGREKIFHENAQKEGLPADLDYATVEQVYDALKSNYDGQLNEQSLLDGIKAGLAGASGDPYTEYLNAEEAKEFDEDLNGSFTGIGAELTKDKDSIIVVAPIAGFPADKAGIRPKDIIAEINGESAYDITVSEAVKKIRGPKDSKVTLKIIRDGQPLTVEVMRDNITIPSVESQIIEGNIGYIKVSRFAEDTYPLSRTAAQNFKSANVKGVILDVRGDPGGLLDASVDVSGLWLENKTVLQEKRDEQVIRTYTSRGTALLKGVPTVVLINEGSASASEITAGALKDHDAATLIGTKSFGKGSVQQLQKLRGGGVLKVTIARWYTPDGKNIDKEGIEPDQKVERSEDDLKNNRDPQKDAAIQLLRQ